MEYMKETKNLIYSIRVSKKQKGLLVKKAEDLGIKPSELVRVHVFKLLEYGTGLENNNSNSKV
jgi:hypothetical protein